MREDTSRIKTFYIYGIISVFEFNVTIFSWLWFLPPVLSPFLLLFVCLLF